MRMHPGKMMLAVWVLVVAAYVILPFRSVEREFTFAGIASLALFIAFFVAGTLVPGRGRVPAAGDAAGAGAFCDASRAERMLMVVCGATVVFLLLDIRGKSIFDLALTYELRSEAADALLNAEASQSSTWFQLAFLLYPAGYVFAVVHVLFARRLSGLRLAAFGLLPVGLATLSMGGRVPIFYWALCAFLAWRVRRRRLAGGHPLLSPLSPLQRGGIALGATAFIAAMTYYFAVVFFVRAEVAGGASEMFDLAESRWGIAFDGALSGPIFALFGPDGAYLLFVFVWYLVQGLVMSTYLFTAYDGPLQFGIYGIDLMSALMRRTSPELVASGFESLLSLNVMGFLPSAFGSLYVDLWYFGVFVCFVWGMLAALVHRRIRAGADERWLVFGPIVTLGIVFSIINTPIGFTNGLVTHFWLLAAFLLLRCHAAPAVAAQTARPSAPAPQGVPPAARPAGAAA